MFQLFKKRAMIYIFLSLTIAMAVLFTFVYVVYSKVLVQDFKDKQLQLVKQVTANITNAFTQIEERAEFFINKNEVSERIKSDMHLQAYNFIIDSTDFEQIGVFDARSDSNVITWNGIDYFQSLDVKKIKNISEDKKWIVEHFKLSNNNIQKLVYVRTLKDDNADVLGYVVFFVSVKQFKDILNFGSIKDFHKTSEGIFSRFNVAGLEISDDILKIGGEKIDNTDFSDIKAGRYQMIDNLTMRYRGDIGNTNVSILIEQRFTYVLGQLRIIRIFLISIYILVFIIIIISLIFLLRKIESSFYELYDKMNNYMS